MKKIIEEFRDLEIKSKNTDLENEIQTRSLLSWAELSNTGIFSNFVCLFLYQ